MLTDGTCKVGKRTWLLGWVLVLALAGPGAALAAEDKPSGEPEKKAGRMAEVVVTARKEAAPQRVGETDFLLTPAFFTVIPDSQFAGRMISLGEIIEKESGVQVRATGGWGSYATVSLRGSDSDQVLVYLDGVLINDAAGGGADLSNISLGDVEAVEIYRGAAPASFARSSLGGVVNVKTSRQRHGLSGKILAGYDSLDTYTASLFMSHKPGRLDYLLSLDYLKSENAYAASFNNFTVFNPHDDAVTTLEHNGVAQLNLLAKAGYDLPGGWRADLSGQVFDKQLELPNAFNAHGAEATYDTRRAMGSFSLEKKGLGPVNARLGLDTVNKQEEYTDLKAEVGLDAQHSFYYTDRYTARLFLEWPTRINLLGLNLAATQELFAARHELGAQNPVDTRRMSFSAVLEDSLLLFGQRLTITPRLRWEHHRDELLAGESYLGTPLAGSTGESGYLLPQAGVRYQAANWLVFKLNLGRYARVPSTSELFGDRGHQIGNPDLTPETGLNLDLGFEIDQRFEKGWLNRAGFYASLFHSQVDDLITIVYDARGVGQAANIAQAEIRGLEAGLNLKVFNLVTLELKATWLDAKNTSDAVAAFNGKQLPGRYRQSYYARLGLERGRLKLWADYTWDRGMFFDSANLLPGPDTDLVGAGASYVLGRWLITMELRNIFDNQYNYAYNRFPSPARSVLVKLKCDL